MSHTLLFPYLSGCVQNLHCIVSGAEHSILSVTKGEEIQEKVTFFHGAFSFDVNVHVIYSSGEQHIMLAIKRLHY